MPVKNTATTIHILVWNTDEQIGQIDDEGNLILRGVGDGAEFTPSAPNITPVDDTNLPGVYSVDLTLGENNYDQVTIGGISSTAYCIVVPFSWANEQIDFSITQKSSLNASTPASVGSVTGNVDGSVDSVTNAVTITSNADITSILADTNEIQGKLPTNYIMGSTVVTSKDGAIDNIETDTNQIQGLITDSKINAQVKGMDTDVLTASALKADTVNEITAAIWAKVIDGTITFATMSKILLAFTTGKVVITSNSFAFYDQSNVLLFTLPITVSGRVPVIA